MCLDSVADLFLITPGYNGIDQRVAASIFEILILPSKCLQVIGIVWQARYISLHVGTRHRPRLSRVSFENHGLRRANPGSSPNCRACFRCVLWWNEVGVRS